MTENLMNTRKCLSVFLWNGLWDGLCHSYVVFFLCLKQDSFIKWGSFSLSVCHSCVCAGSKTVPFVFFTCVCHCCLPFCLFYVFTWIGAVPCVFFTFGLFLSETELFLTCCPRLSACLSFCHTWFHLPVAWLFHSCSLAMSVPLIFCLFTWRISVPRCVFIFLSVSLSQGYF